MRRLTISDIQPLVSCRSCGGNFAFEQASAVCKTCDASYPIRSETLFISEPPSDVPGNDKLPVYDTWSSWRKANYHFYEIEFRGISNDANVLDIGAGPSQFQNLLSRFDRVVGTDFYPFEFVNVVTDISKSLPFRDESFDLLVLSNVVEHIPNTQSLFLECKRVLKKRGIMLVTVPFLMRIHQEPYDFNRHTHYQLSKIMVDTGFVDVDITSLGTSFDVYEQVQTHFFGYLISTHFSDSVSLNVSYRFLARLCRFILRLYVLLWSPLLKLARPSKGFTAGYGCRAIKP